MTEITTIGPKVWIGCLACYNAGDLIGQWVDATEAAEFVPCTRSEFGAQHEEFWVMDHDGFVGFLKGECSPSEAQKIAERMAEIESEGCDLAAVAAYVDNLSLDVGDLDLDQFMDAYEGRFDSDKDFAQDWARGLGAVKEDDEWPHTCIDWERAARELMYDHFEQNHYYFRSM